MNPKIIARIISVGFFFTWLAILYAGADHPPPPGFILIVMFDLFAAIAVYYRVPIYLGWHTTRNKYRWIRVIAEGLAAGLTLALVTILVPGGGEPGTPRSGLPEYLIWFSVVGMVGVINSMAVYGTGNILAKIRFD